MNKVYFIGRDSIPARFVASDGEELNLTFVALPGVSEDVAIEVDIEGRDALVDIAGVYLCTSDDRLSLKVNLRHNSGGSLSRQVFKGIVAGAAVANFDGLIYVAHDSQKTKAYQENHTILLSSRAKVESKPQLEIYADDVECSHGSTSGFLSGEELFYMRSRGIPEEEALRLQKIAFIAPVVNRLSEDLAAEIYDNIP